MFAEEAGWGDRGPVPSRRRPHTWLRCESGRCPGGSSVTPAPSGRVRRRPPGRAGPRGASCAAPARAAGGRSRRRAAAVDGPGRDRAPPTGVRPRPGRPRVALVPGLEPLCDQARQGRAAVEDK